MPSECEILYEARNLKPYRYTQERPEGRHMVWSRKEGDITFKLSRPEGVDLGANTDVSCVLVQIKDEGKDDEKKQMMGIFERALGKPRVSHQTGNEEVVLWKAVGSLVPKP